MTTAYQIIVDAYRQSNLIALGINPTQLQETEALRYLNRIVKSVFGNEAGESLTALPVGSNNVSRPISDNTFSTEWIVPKNVRLMLNLSTPESFYLHPTPDDGTRFAVSDASNNIATNNVTVYGNGNMIEGGTSLALNTNGLDSEWVYRTDQAAWLKSSPLTLFDTFPFPEEFDDYFIILLAFRLNPAYERQLDQQSAVMMERSKSQLRTRYSQESPAPSELALIRMSKMSADRNEWARTEFYPNPTTLFNKGWFW